MKTLFLLMPLLLLFSIASISSHADKVDDYIREQMTKRSIPGLSLAIFQDGKIVKAKGYGVLEKGSQTPVTPSTLFQAASISKSVTDKATHYVLIHLTADGLITDEDVIED